MSRKGVGAVTGIIGSPDWRPPLLTTPININGDNRFGPLVVRLGDFQSEPLTGPLFWTVPGAPAGMTVTVAGELTVAQGVFMHTTGLLVTVANLRGDTATQTLGVSTWTLRLNVDPVTNFTDAGNPNNTITNHYGVKVAWDSDLYNTTQVEAYLAHFDTGYLQCLSTSVGLPLAGDFTLQVVFQPSFVGAPGKTQVLLYVPGEMRIYLEPATGQICMADANGVTALGIFAQNGNWYRVAVQRTGGTVMLYVNGEVILNQENYNVTINPDGLGIYIGGTPTMGLTTQFFGRVRSVLVHSGSPPVDLVL